MLRKIIKPLAEIRVIAGLALLATLVLSAYHFHLWREARVYQFRTGTRLVAPVGMTLDGTVLSSQSWTDRCYVLRYASKTCAASRSDVEVLRQIENGLRMRGCGSVLLAPSKEVFPETQASRINIVSTRVSFAHAADFTFTPTTMVVDHEWRILWAKVGSLNPSDVQPAVFSVQ